MRWGGRPRSIRDGQGHAVLALNAHQPTLHADVQARFAEARAAKPSEYGITSATETTSGHGRIATRTADVISAPAVIADLNPGDRWRDWAGGRWRKRSARLMGRHDRTAALSLGSGASPTAVNALVRSHWGIEHRVHWALDVIFHEDASRIRTGAAPQHMGVVRHIAPNLIRQASRTGSVKAERFHAALNEDYLACVLGI